MLWSPKDGQAKLLPLAQAKSFNVYTQEEVVLAVGDTLRITKNFRVGRSRFRNNELCTVTAIDEENITVDDGRVIESARTKSLVQSNPWLCLRRIWMLIVQPVGIARQMATGGRTERVEHRIEELRRGKKFKRRGLDRERA
jgi:hypothetical protein